MKEISELTFPDDLRYAEDHEWAKQDGDTIKIGISDYAQDQLGDIVFVELPAVGDTFERVANSARSNRSKPFPSCTADGWRDCGHQRSLEDAPEFVNNAPYTDGWMIELKPADPTEYRCADGQACLS